MKDSSKNFELVYPGKKEVKVVLNNTHSSTLELIRGFPKDGATSDHYDNLLIWGDNLNALSYLLKKGGFKEKIKLIYIDPPFSTNQTFRNSDSSHAYDDFLKGAEYIEFIRERLLLLKELLAKDGSIYVHLDGKMAFPIKIIMDEIFGQKNFRNWITRKKSSYKNSTSKQYGNIQDYILFYSKSEKYIWNKPYQKNGGTYSFEQRFPKIEAETGRRYALVPVHAPGTRSGETGGPWNGVFPPKGKHWQMLPSKLDALNKKGEIYWSKNGNPRRKLYADQDKGVTVQDIWLDFPDAINQNTIINNYPTENNADLLRRIINTSSNEGDIVLDCFAGSGTTVSVADELNRKWIGIDVGKLSINTTIKRLSGETKGDSHCTAPAKFSFYKID